MPYFIGVDLHTDNFVACYLRNGKVRKYTKFSASASGIKKFIGTATAQDEVAVEATGNAGHFCKLVKPHVRRVMTVAPSQFSQISQSNKKTDRNDAKCLAIYLSKDLLPRARIKSDTARLVRSLVDTRAQFVKMRRSLINKAHSILIRHGYKPGKGKLSGKKSFQRHVFSKTWDTGTKLELEIIHDQIVNLRKNLELLDNEIAAQAEKMPGYENLMSIKGIGGLSAAIFLCVIDDIRNFKTAAHLVSYFGIAPATRMSNDNYKSSRITKAGSKLGRTALVQCTMSALKYSPYLQKFYKRIKKRRGSGRAIIACARKFLIIIFNTLKNDWIFDDFIEFKYRQRIPSSVRGRARANIPPRTKKPRK